MESSSEDVRPLQARVAKRLDARRIVINRGSQHGVTLGQRFVVFEPGEEVTDPDTGESLGALELVKARGAVIHVQPHLAILGLEPPRQGRVKTPSEIMASLSGLDEDEMVTGEVAVGDYARPEG